MQFCLGLGAKASGRAGSAKELVRSGASHAKAALSLCNSGRMRIGSRALSMHVCHNAMSLHQLFISVTDAKLAYRCVPNCYASDMQAAC